MATVLVSFIGTGSRSNNEYETTKYFFEGETDCRETSIFGAELLRYLKDNQRNVDRWLILGTDKAIWSELIKMFPDLFSGSGRNLKDTQIEEQREFLEDEAFYCQAAPKRESRIKQERLDEWQKVLTDNLTGTRVICRIVGDATNPESQNLIFKSLLDEIEENNKVVFDVTHGLRNQPIVTSFVLMYLRYLRNIEAENIEFYYGAKDLDGKVVRLDFCNELLKATEAVAIYKQTGNYEKIGEQIDIDNNFKAKLAKLTFADEMHKADTETPQEIINILRQQRSKLSPLKKSLADYLENALDWANKKSFADRLKEKAERAFKHKQYFKAIASLWESLGVISCDAAQKNEYGRPINPNDFTQRNWAVKRREGFNLPENNDNQLKNVEHLRNTVLHGSEDKKPKIQEATEDVTKFEKIFNGGLEVFEIIKSKIKT